MSRRKAIAVLALLCGMSFLICCSRSEPSWHGKPLSRWPDDLDDGEAGNSVGFGRVPPLTPKQLEEGTSTTFAQGGTYIEPAPKGEELSADYEVRLNGKALPIYTCKVASGDPVLRWRAMDDKEHSGEFFAKASFGYFDMDGMVRVRVICPEEIQSVKILPSSLKIDPLVRGRVLDFWLKKPSPITVEVNGNWVGALHLFANAPDPHPPRTNDPNVIYFGPGIHEVSHLIVTNGQTVYVAAGAVVRGVVRPGEHESGIILLKGGHIRLCGRGIIDGSLCPVHTRNLLQVQGSDIEVEGVILRDSSTWTVPIRRSDRVTIKNVKLLGYRANSDGIDICNSQNVTVRDCFIRTLDDLIVVKTDHREGEARHILAEHCVLWNEVAHALSIGAELRENVDDVVFRDCDVIHDKGREWTLRVYHCDSALVSHVTFENLRIEESKRLISLWINRAVWNRDSERGHIDGVLFKDITAQGDPLTVDLSGFDPEHLVRDVTFDHVLRNGQPLTRAEVKTNAFVRNVVVRP